MVKSLIFFIAILFLEILPCHSDAQEVRGTLSLVEGLRIVTEDNRLVRIAKFNEDISREDVNLAKSGFYPELNAFVRETFLAYQPGARFGMASVPTAERSSLSYGINIYQRVYDFQKTPSLYKASLRSLEKTIYDIKRIKNLVALDFINTYLDLLEAEKLINVHEREVERYSSHVRDARNLYSEGVITKNELLQAEVKLADAMRRYNASKNMRSLARYRLNILLGRPIDDELVIEDIGERMEHLSFDSIMKDKEIFFKIAEERRPEIKSIELEIDTYIMKMNAARADYYPEIFVMGGYEYTENRYQLHEDNWSFITGININISSGGRTKSEISKISWRIEQLREEKKKMLDELRLDVNKSLLDLEYAIENLRLSETSLKQAEENLRINTVRFTEGVGTSTEVTDAISLLTLEETSYYRAIYNLIRAEASLQYSLGEDLVIYYANLEKRYRKE